MISPLTALIAAATSAVPKLSRYAASARGVNAAATKPSQPIPADLMIKAASGKSTRKPR